MEKTKGAGSTPGRETSTHRVRETVAMETHVVSSVVLFVVKTASDSFPEQAAFKTVRAGKNTFFQLTDGLPVSALSGLSGSESLP